MWRLFGKKHKEEDEETPRQIELLQETVAIEVAKRKSIKRATSDKVQESFSNFDKVMGQNHFTPKIKEAMGGKHS